MKFTNNSSSILKLILFCCIVLQVIPLLENRKFKRKIKHSKKNTKKNIIYTEVPENTRTGYFSNMEFRSSLSQEKWMGNLNQNLKISKFSIPGTHDSGSFDFPYIPSPVEVFSKTQKWTIREQLKAGIRYLDIRIGNDGMVHHGVLATSISFNQVLSDVTNFLNTNPSEAIIMRIRNENTSFFTRRSTQQVFENLIGPYINKFVFENRIPTLKQIKGKIWPILDDLSYSNSMYWNAIRKQDKYEITDTFSISDKKKSIISFNNDMNRYFVENMLYFNHCSAHGTYIRVTIQTIAKSSNEVVAELQGNLGIIVFDFPSEEVIKKVIDRNPKSRRKLIK